MMLILCPFHADTRPSLSIDEEKGVWYCFGCGARGTLYDLLREIGLPPSQALRVLAHTHTSLLPARTGRPPRTSSPTWPHNSYPDLLKFWAGVRPSDVGAGYALKRGFTAEELSSWGVDYAPLRILFPEYAFKYGEKGKVSTWREAWPGGSYRHVGPASQRGRVAFYTDRAPTMTFIVEGPFDALRVASALEVPALVCATGGIVLPANLVEPVIVIPDNDEGGDRLWRMIRARYHSARRVQYEGRDPAELSREQVREVLAQCL